MGFFDKAKDKTKDLGKKGLDLGEKAGKKGVELGKKGYDGTKETLRTKTCSECKEYNVVDETKGNCKIAGERLATADSATCPQKAFAPIEAEECCCCTSCD